MHILVTGGAGYIGSHMVRYLVERNCRVTVLDNLSTGHADAVWSGARLVEGDIGDRGALKQLLKNAPFDGVFHFAAASQVTESVAQPQKYYANNVVGSLTLFDTLIAHGVQNVIFSSSAAVYGEPSTTPVTESHTPLPINTYGRTKIAIEGVLADYYRAHGFNSISLRYFNAAGAHPDGRLAERHHPETHLIPRLLAAASQGGAEVSVFGTDYPTPDGTCIRDYIHVQDLCEAHWLAMRKLLVQGGNRALNLGYGRGFSVLEVVDAVEAVTGRRLRISRAERRPGDPASLVANATQARRELNWIPKRADLRKIVQDTLNALAFHKNAAL